MSLKFYPFSGGLPSQLCGFRRQSHDLSYDAATRRCRPWQDLPTADPSEADESRVPVTIYRRPRGMVTGGRGPGWYHKPHIPNYLVLAVSATLP